MESNNVGQSFLDDVVDGLSQPQKTLDPKYFYDDYGSLLFEHICELDEYYLTRTEVAIMEASCDEMATAIGPDAVIIEPGSGAGTKTKLLLGALRTPAAYVPIEISDDALSRSTTILRKDLPKVRVFPICADFTNDVDLPRDLPSHARRRIVYFPGTTIGNFEPHDRLPLLRRFRKLAGKEGGALMGVDLQKADTDIVFRAYNDSRNVTAAFTTNILARINRELGADFDLEQFTHYAPYDAKRHRIEIRLCSNVEQTVTIRGHTFNFARDEYIIAEYSHKFDISSFSAEMEAVGFRLSNVWTDKDRLFGVLFFQSDCQKATGSPLD